MSKRNLATLDRDIFQGTQRILQEAMSHGITNDLVFGGLESGQSSLSAIHAVDATQNCSIGTRRITWDGRVFKYHKAANTLKSHWGAKCWAEEHVKWASVAATAVVGAATVQVTVAATDGIAVATGKNNSGNIAANELYGGYVCFYETGSDLVRENHLIVANTAVSGGGAMTITLDRALGVEMTTSSYVEIMGNPYWNVYGPGNDGYTSVVDIPTRVLTVGQFGWGQTWGPICISPGGTGQGANGVGSTGEEREVVFGGNGCIFERNVSDNPDQRQRAGFIINMSTTAAGGPPFIMLQLSP